MSIGCLLLSRHSQLFSPLLTLTRRAVPALEHAAPAVPAELPQPIASPRPLGMLTSVLGRATKGLQEGGDADSPINGLLYVSGNITGSSAQPTGEVAVRLYDAAVGEQNGVQSALRSASCGAPDACWQ